MLLGDAMTMREAIRRREIGSQDVFSLGLQTLPASSLAMKPQQVEMFAAFLEEDYELYARIVHSSPMGAALNAAAGPQNHPFCRGDTPLWLPIDPRHNPPGERPTHANVNAKQIEKIWELCA